MADRRPPPGRAAGWLAKRVPRREHFENNRWMRPVAHRVLAPALWRFTRRSVPRGVALGILTGILVPFAQIPLAAVLAFPFRANIPAAALTTFITNPLTAVPIWAAAYWLGKWILRIDATVPGRPIASNVGGDPGWMHWLMVDAGPATAAGLVTMAVVGALVGYGLAVVGWRWWVARKWKRRSRRPR